MNQLHADSFLKVLTIMKHEHFNSLENVMEFGLDVV